MCGIVGHVGKWAANSLPLMLQSLAHRGPDGSGFWQNTEMTVGLAHARLAIIDLSTAGLQPMWNATGRHCITFNGEIYNYRELRAELEATGVRFRGNSDTEVLAEFYARHGTQGLGRLNGIFAFAIWDELERTLLLVRDGLGVKPLYWTRHPQGIAFASELKALCVIPGLDRRLNPAAIASYLGLVYSPGVGTPCASVQKFLPGHAMKFDESGRVMADLVFYRRPCGPVDQERNQNRTAEALMVHLDKAVERQLVSDAPLGAFLSGGLDSSAIVASAVRAAAHSRMPCYTIRPKQPDGSRDGFQPDLPYARKVAQHLRVDLREVEVSPEQLLDLDGLIWMLDEPQPDPAALNAHLIVKQARKDGLKVLLSGVGGDDIFSGYRRHTALQAERLWSWFPRPLRGLLSLSASRLPKWNVTSRRVSKLFAYADKNTDERIAGYFLWLSDSETKGILQPEFAKSLSDSHNADLLVEHLRTLPIEMSGLQRMLDLEQAYFLTDHNLNYTDKVSMAAGVEVRVPLLDPDLMAFAATIPDSFKVRGAEAKWIFKKAMESRLPKEVIYRSKSGFGAPLRDWLHTELASKFEEYLSSTRIKTQGVFNADAVRNLLMRDKLGQIDAAYPLLGVLCVDSWIRQFGGEVG